MDSQILNKSKKKLHETQVNYRSAVVFMITSMIGIGYLTLSASLRMTGLILGLMLVFITALASLFGTFMIGQVNFIMPSKSYPCLVLRVLGKKQKKFMVWDLLIYILFSTTMYIYFAESLVVVILDKYHVHNYPSHIILKLILAMSGFIMGIFKL